MADIKVKYKNNKGFWVVEDVMELAFQYIYKELKTGNYSFSNKDELLMDSKSNINGWSRGYMAFMWHKYLNSPIDEQEMIRLLETILNELNQKGSYISVEEMHAFPSEAEDWKSFWDKPFKTQNLINVFEALISMLKGEWESTNYNMDKHIDWE